MGGDPTISRPCERGYRSKEARLFDCRSIDDEVYSTKVVLTTGIHEVFSTLRS